MFTLSKLFRKNYDNFDWHCDNFGWSDYDNRGCHCNNCGFLRQLWLVLWQLWLIATIVNIAAIGITSWVKVQYNPSCKKQYFYIFIFTGIKAFAHLNTWNTKPILWEKETGMNPITFFWDPGPLSPSRLNRWWVYLTS